MKKLFAFILCFGTMPVWAANMCVKNDTVMVVLDPTIWATSANVTSNVAERTWSAKHSYGTISGISGCYTKPSTNTPLIPTNQSAISQASTGSGCYCKMLRPAISQWVYIPCPNCTTETQCGPNGECVRRCGVSFSSAGSQGLLFKQLLFGSVGVQ